MKPNSRGLISAQAVNKLCEFGVRTRQWTRYYRYRLQHVATSDRVTLFQPLHLLLPLALLLLSPWYNRNDWLGVKHQVIYLLFFYWVWKKKELILFFFFFVQNDLPEHIHHHPTTPSPRYEKEMARATWPAQSSGAVWKSKWPSWAPRPNEPYGFCGRKATLNHAVDTICP